FAARITTWDMQDGAAYRAAELASLNRMINAKPECPRHDNKITDFYDSNGTGNQWTSVPEKYIPGSWAWNAYKVDVNEDGDYIVGINTDISNPAYSDFQVRVVVYNKGTGERSYHPLGVAAAGKPSSIKVSTLAGDELYLVVATTPDIFSGWDWYPYKFKIHPDRIPPPVAAPTNLSAIGGENQVYLDWDDNTEPNLAGYNVFRSTTSGTEYVQIATAVLTSEYVDSNVIGGMQYYYVVTAIDTSDNESDHSNEASATPNDTVAPAAPAGLSAKACGSQVYLDWDDNTEPDIAGYNIYRSTSSGGGYVRIVANLTTSAYSDGDVDNGITYYYVVTAEDLNGNESGYSDEVSAMLSEKLDIACGLIGYWPFDNSAEDKAGSNDGTLQGGASYVPGKLGQALACNSQGTLDYVRLNRTDSLNGNWTAAAWMNVHNQDVGGFLCGGSCDIRCPGQFGASSHPGLTDTVTNVNASWDGTDSQSQAYSLPSETWALLVFVGTDTDANGMTDQCELFADGVSQGVLVFTECKGTQGSDPSGTPIQFILTWNRIGDLDQYSGYGNAVADYDEVAVWSRALNEDEIAWLYNDGEGNKIIPDGDVSLDGCVNLVDLAWLAGYWQEGLCSAGNGWCGGADLAPEIPDGVVNGLDLAVVVNNWLAGVRELPGQGPAPATNPNPSNGAMGVSTTTGLSWTAGAGAVSHDVYIGTSNPPPFISNVSDTTFIPGWLPYQTNIYWRIDGINEWGRTTGEVWEFTTVSSPPPMPGQASNPNPADGATGISIDQDLSWTPGSGATSHDVYFGTSMILPFIKNQTAATFDPGRMELGTKYYWRINEKTTSGTIVGQLWSFTASTIPPPPP
ncbi:MAG: hypothetical protein GWN94_05485, partial [Phycisphaerae bacterium]|nr:hypothetical protein [Phycisphaerae bacterium]NIS50557.1 hypothetical protein [Phycisphaerae bacterium]NIW97754.1 hypothetical protein [Phycisphaerae bacterium]